MTVLDSSKLSFIADHIREHAIVHKEDQTIVGTDGRKQNWLIDLRMSFLDVEALDRICDLFWDLYEDQLPFQFGGMEVAAVPLVTGLLFKAKERGLKTNGFILRKDRKATGLGKVIEGTLNDDPVILVDDLMNSGASLEKCRVVLEQEGRNVQEVFVVIDYQSDRGAQWVESTGMNVSSLFKLEEFDLNIQPQMPPYKFQYTITWRHYTKGAYPFSVVPKSGPLVVGHNIYYGTSSAKMICVNRHTGETVWEYFAKGAQTNPKGILSFPAHHEGKIYFGAYNGIMYCLDAKTGEQIWLNPCCEWIGSSPLIVPEHNLLYVGLEYQRPRMMGSNAALRLDNGARVWEVGQTKYQHGSATYYAPMDAVIFGNANHDVTAYEAKTGKEIWQLKTERSIKYPPSIDVGRKLVATSSFDGNIYIQDVETGEKKAAIQTDDICYSTPLFTEDKIFCGSGDRHMYIIDADSLELIKRIDCGARVFSSPSLIDGNVIFGTSGGRILEIEPESLDVVGKAQLPDAVTNRVVATENADVLYARTHMDELYAIERSLYRG